MADAPHFLYVEDDANNRKILKLLLVDMLGYENLVIFEDTANFIERLAALSPLPNVIFLDLQISPIDGFEACRLVRSDARFNDCQIIALTSNLNAEDYRRLKELACNGVIRKPLSQENFEEQVSQILAKKSVWDI